MNNQITLTPAQTDFCKKEISGFNEHTWHVSIAGKAGSDRSFIRLAPKGGPGPSRILVLWDSHDSDWERFIAINNDVAEKVPSLLPEIYATDNTHGLILEEDCGEHRLKEHCLGGHNKTMLLMVYQQVLDALIVWQHIPVDASHAIASRKLDTAMYLWETEYFAAHCVSEYFGLDTMLTKEWHHERESLAREVAGLPMVYLHRDFQSENIMLHDTGIMFVDYQGARLGAAEYDLASLLFDPYVSVITDEMRHTLLAYYNGRCRKKISLHTFHIAAMQRLAQACGAYGNLSLHKGKVQYREFIPRALRQLNSILRQEERFPIFQAITAACITKTEETET
jgi:hypothetical protein